MFKIRNICLFATIFNKSYSMNNFSSNLNNNIFNNYVNDFVNNIFNNNNVNNYVNNILGNGIYRTNNQIQNFNLMINHNMDEFRMYFDNFLIEVFANERAERFLDYMDRRFHITPFMVGRFLGIFINITMFYLIYFHFDNLRNENRNLDLFK